MAMRVVSLTTLRGCKQSVAFAEGLWRAILTAWKLRLLITIETETFANLRTILLALPGALARLPHLSRVALVSRTPSRPQMDRSLASVSKTMRLSRRDAGIGRALHGGAEWTT